MDAMGRDVFVADLHVTRTWLPPTNGDLLLHFPKDAIIIPLWIPGQEHYTIYTTLLCCTADSCGNLDGDNRSGFGGCS
uniref:Zisupton n=1 Tax=Nothobranchius furzeri TaxID=105023 RepID=A0A1A8B6F4_NOTFU